MKIRSVEDELFHADGQRDMTKLKVAFRNFVVLNPHKQRTHRILNHLGYGRLLPYNLSFISHHPTNRRYTDSPHSSINNLQLHK